MLILPVASPVCCVPGTGLQATIHNLTLMEGNVGKMISSLNMGTKHLTEDPVFSAQLASAFARVVDLVEIMRRYRAVYVYNCCSCFGCCMTDGFGGSGQVKEIAEKLEALVKQVRASFKLDIQLGGVNRVQGEVGHEVAVSARSHVQLSEVNAQARHEFRQAPALLASLPLRSC